MIKKINTKYLTFVTILVFTAIACDRGPRPHAYSQGGPITCSGSKCLVVGSYLNKVGGFAPLLAFSTNGGVSFTSTSAIMLPDDAATGADEKVDLGSITCSGSKCLIVGSYVNKEGGTAPLLAFSTNGGVSYTSTSAVMLPDDAATGANESASLAGLTCSGSNCLAVGFYMTQGGGLLNIAPLLAFSTNGGVSYTSTSAVDLPGNFSTIAAFAALSGITCSGSNCYAVGEYITNTPGGAISPLLAFSTNGGMSYTSTSAVTLPDNTAVPEIAGLIGITCSGSKCLAVGTYNYNANESAPLLAFSTDGGVTYASTSAIALPEDAIPGTTNQLAGITCSGSKCLVVGAYNNRAGGIAPLLGFSTNAGVSYTSTSAITLPEDAAVGANEKAYFGIR